MVVCRCRTWSLQARGPPDVLACLVCIVCVGWLCEHTDARLIRHMQTSPTLVEGVLVRSLMAGVVVYLPGRLAVTQHGWRVIPFTTPSQDQRGQNRGKGSVGDANLAYVLWPPG